MNSTLQALLRQNYLSFGRKAIRDLQGITLGDEPYLKFLAGELDKFAEGETRRLIINLPPGHLKTLLGSVVLTAWMLAHDPSLKIIIVTHAEHLSKTIARYIRSILQSSWFKEVFATRIKKGHAEVTDFGTTTGGGVFVASFRGGITGRRADVIVVDDPHDIGDELEQIESTIESFNTVLLSRLNDRKTGRVLVIAHRVHERDLSAYLLRKNKTKKWKHVVLPLVATEDQTYQTAAGIWRRNKGELLRPDAFGPEDLDDLRQSSFNPDFGMLYQQDFDFQALPAITDDHFGIFLGSMRVPGPVVLSVDAGMTKGRRNAYSVVQAWCLTGDDYYLIDQFREQTDFANLRDNLRHLRKIHRPAAILIERAANGHALISDLTRKFGNLVIPIDPDGRSKSARLRAHADTIIAKRIWLPAQASWRNDFVREFVEFPNGKFTDQVDATTQFLDHAGKFAGLAPTPQAGLAAAVNRGGLARTISSSDGRERGLAAGVRGNGQPITNRQSGGPFFFKKWS
jgi:predicted phage terminase large subunit-like protein